MKRSSYCVFLLGLVLLALLGAGCTAQMRAAYHLHRAERYYQAGQFAAAEIEYKNVLRHTPQNTEAWCRLGIIYFNEGRPLEALPILSRAEQLAPTNLEVRVKLGSLDLAFGRLNEAKAEADYVLERRPQDDQAVLLLADAAATNEIPAVRQRLQTLQHQHGDSAPLQVALGTLALRERDYPAAEAAFQRATTLDPHFGSAYTALGNLYVARKDLKQAESAFERAAELSPPWSGAGVRYAQFKILTGEAAQGKLLLEEITQKNPDYLPAWTALAQLAAAERNYTNGLALLNNVLSRDPQNYDGLLLQGRLQLLLGQTNQAVDSFERMARIFPEVPSVQVALAQAYLVNNRTNEAYARINQALQLQPGYPDAVLLLAEIRINNGDPASAIVALRELVRKQPDLLQAWLLLANAYGVEGDAEAADRIYRQLETNYPQSPEFPLLRGILFVQQQQNAAARREFEQALKIAPDNLIALESLINLDLAEKQYTAAARRVQQKLQQHTNSAPLLVLWGKVLAAQGETNRAEAALTQAIALQPEAQSAYLLLAQLYVSAGQTRKALANLQAALAKDPNDAAALTLMGVIYDATKDFDRARDAYEKLLDLLPNNALALNNLACDYADHFHQLDKAYPLARRARDAAPSNPSIADTLGWILCRKGQYVAALPLLRESAEKLYDVPEIQFHLGMACYMTGRETEARTAFQRALNVAGDFPEKTECSQRLAILNLDPDKAGADQRSWLEKWSDRHPDDPVALARLAAIYQRTGMGDKALTIYQTILKTDPQNVTALSNLARLLAPSDAAKAYAYAKTAYQLVPNDPGIAHLAGHLAFLTGDFRWALTLLQLAAQAQPQDPETQFDLAQAFYSQGRVPEARAAMQKALQLQTNFARADDAKRFLSLTALAAAPAQALAAQPQIADILKSAPDYVPALMVQAVIAAQQGDLPAAQRLDEQILQQYPDFAPAQKQLALIYVRNPKNDDQAYPLALKARAAFPNDPEVARCLGILLCRRGDYARAVSLLQESAPQFNRDAEVQFYLGMAQYHLNHSAESKTALQQALNLNLSGASAAEARRILAELK
jgi:Flp pilus assembly protein TadD